MSEGNVDIGGVILGYGRCDQIVFSGENIACKLKTKTKQTNKTVSIAVFP